MKQGAEVTPARVQNEIAILEKNAQTALDLASRKNSDDASIYGISKTTLEIKFENFAPQIIKSVEEQNMEVDVYQNNRRGKTLVGSLTPEAMTDAVEEALLLARFSPPVEKNQISLPEFSPQITPPDWFFDEKIAVQNAESICESLEVILSEMHRDTRVKMERFTCTVGVTGEIILNSRGTFQQQWKTSQSLLFIGNANDGTRVSGRDYIFAEDITSQCSIQKLRRQIPRYTEMLVSGLNPIQIPSRKGTVIFGPSVLEKILVSVIRYHVSGSSVSGNRSRWAESLGQKVASENFHFSDIPFRPCHARSVLWDREGTPTKSVSIIREGRLLHHIHDSSSGLTLGLTSSGHAGFTFYGPMIEAGNYTLSEMIAAQNRILVVERFSGQVNPDSGDFSGIVQANQYYENGQFCGVVTDTLISGNAFDVMNAMLAVGNETRVEFGGTEAPYILVDGISVTGSRA